MPAMMAIFSVLLAGCTLRLFNPLLSEWKALDDAESVSCDRWPVQVSDLSLDDVRVIQNSGQHGFYMKATTRKGGKQFYTGLFPENFTVTQEVQKPLTASAASVWAGGGGGVWSTLAESGEGDGGDEGSLTLVLRSLQSNAVSPVRLPDDVDKVYLMGDAGGVWVSYEREKGFSLSFLQTSPGLGAAPSFKPVTGTYREKPVAVGNLMTGGAWMLVPVEDQRAQARAPASGELDGDINDAAASVSFEWRQISAPGHAGRGMKLRLPANEGIEGWDVKQVPGGFALAYVEGDSLVGDSRLQVAWVDIRQNRPVVTWLKTFELENIHVGDPSWNGAGGRLHLYLLQWVDGEATLGSWKVTAAGVTSQPLKGLFPKGATLMDTLVDRKTSVEYALVRFREDLNWQFELCELP